MSSLMYPKVFSDYMARIAKLGPLLKLLPTRVYWYAMVAGDAFTFSLNKQQLSDLLITVPAFAANAADTDMFTARLELTRVSAVQRSHRSVVLRVQVQQQGVAGAAVHEEVQQVQVKDTGGVFVFEGPMADPAKPLQEVKIIHKSCFAFALRLTCVFQLLIFYYFLFFRFSWLVPWLALWRRWL